ncbi:thioredoxin domain-containing protein [Caulobacter sp. AP07]|uniref:surface lipoprotein assembly modifier n=1 Tax=Caulobacter sp. AP07 TaxID=1144304 RepID=UPI00027206A9|nr:surface lipoprotein assembly modifier [Caulobacter sp. AP07]EJL34733.1 thioredoxin domain-containing protein [Caulobacter sp. AP07]
MRLGGRAAFAALAAAIVLAPGPARAQSEEAREAGAGVVTLSGDQAFATALQLFIRAGDYRQALDLIDTRPDLADRADVVRLRAQLMALTGREPEALALLEGHLTRDAADALARFQVAELHFAAGRDVSAALAYRLSLAGALDPGRARIANLRLEQIQQRRRWRFWAGASVAPDSNVNGATNASRIELFGLPFELDDKARRRSGVTVSAQGGVERRFRLDGRRAVRAALVGAVTDAPGGDFDDAFLSLRAGPEWTLSPRAQVTLQAAVNGRWYGGALLETSRGLRVEGELSTRDNIRWVGAARFDLVDARINDGRDGELYGLELARTRYLGPTSLWRASGSLTAREARSSTEAYDQVQLAAGRLYPLPFTTLAYVEPYVMHRRFDGLAPAFGKRRIDSEYGVVTRLSKRDWTLKGAFPFVALSMARNDSTIVLNSFTRRRVEVGLTREF